jgi:Phage tail assembly chaperone protein
MNYLYRLSDGVFTGQAFRIDPPDPDRFAEHVPEGCGAFDGEVDVRRQRFDAATGKLVDYRMAAPPDSAWWTYEWDERTYDWLAKPTGLAIAAEARAERDRRLAACDWTQVADTALSADQQAQWAGYRTALRNLTRQPGFPDSFEWPTSPS